MFELRRMTHADVAVEHVMIAPTYPLTRHIPSLDKVRNDPLRCALRDAHGLCDVAYANVRVALQAEEHLGVVGDEVPAL